MLEQPNGRAGVSEASDAGSIPASSTKADDAGKQASASTFNSQLGNPREPTDSA